MGNDTEKAPSWPEVVRFIKGDEARYVDVLNKAQDNLRDRTGKEIAQYALIENAIRSNYIAEYLIPKELEKSLQDSRFDLDIPLGRFINLPHPVMAVANAEDRSQFEVWSILDGALWVVNPSSTWAIKPSATVRDYVDKFGSDVKSFIFYTLALLLYISGGDVEEARIPGGKGKKQRHRFSADLIRGTVGGKFISALKRYE